MSNNLTPSERALRNLSNAQLAAVIDGPRTPSGLPHPDGSHLKPVRPKMREATREAARRLRWADAYDSRREPAK